MHIRAPIWVLCLALAGCAVAAAPRTISPKERLRQNGETVVQIVHRTVSADRETRLGTGVAVHRDGYVLTNFHIVDLEPRSGSAAGTGNYLVCSVVSDVQVCQRAELIASEPAHDLALLRVEDRRFDRVAEFTDDMDAALGDEIYVWGNLGRLAPPSPIYGSLMNWMTPGYVRSDRLQMGPPPQVEIELPLLLLDLSSQTGTNGGPVFLRDDGRCIAVLFAAVRIERMDAPIDMAIPSSRILPFLKRNLPAR